MGTPLQGTPPWLRLGRDLKSATLRLGSKGELLRRAIWHMMDDNYAQTATALSKGIHGRPPRTSPFEHPPSFFHMWLLDRYGLLIP